MPTRWPSPNLGTLLPLEHVPVWHVLPGRLAQLVEFPGPSAAEGSSEGPMWPPQGEDHVGWGWDAQVGSEGLGSDRNGDNVKAIVLRVHGQSSQPPWLDGLVEEAQKRGLLIGLLVDAEREPQLALPPFGSFVTLSCSPAAIAGDGRRRCLQTIQSAREKGIWVEVALPVAADSRYRVEDVVSLASQLAAVDCNIPCDFVAMPVDYTKRSWRDTLAIRDTILALAEVLRQEGLRFVYAAGLPGMVGILERLYCPECGEFVVDRTGGVLQYAAADGTCPDCGYRVPGIWESEPPARFHC